MAATWFKGVQRRICLDYNDTLINYFINALLIPLALLTIATIAMCAPEPITAELTSTTYLKKQAYLHLQQRELDQDFASGLVPFCASKLLWINETKRVRRSEEIRIHEESKVESEFVDVYV